MSSFKEEISQISIYLKDENEKVNEVALLNPLHVGCQFDTSEKTLSNRLWRFESDLSLKQKISIKIQAFLYKQIPQLIPPKRKTPEAKLKTVLALLLAQQDLRKRLLSTPSKRKAFFETIKNAADDLGIEIELPASVEDPDTLSSLLTKVEGCDLMSHPLELNRQIAALSFSDRNEILFRILNALEHPPIHSVLEVVSSNHLIKIPLSTLFCKFQIEKFDEASGEFSFSCECDHSTSSIRTLYNSYPNAKGASNQRGVIDPEKGERLGFYSGELATPSHVLEQLLFILENQIEALPAHAEKSQLGLISSNPISSEDSPETSVLFTSLYGWTEIGFLTDQHVSIQKWDQKLLEIANRPTHLHLLHYNIPFKSVAPFPTPAEIGSTFQDLNDECLITLAWEGAKKLEIEFPKLEHLYDHLFSLRKSPPSSYLERQKILLDLIDLFKDLKKEYIQKLCELPKTALNFALQRVVSGKEKNGHKLNGFDHLLYLNIIAKQLGYLHTKNCPNGLDRVSGADAADKAAHAFLKIQRQVFLPGSASEKESSLFKALYSLYLVWEEPEVSTALSTGFVGEKFYQPLFRKNPETTRYLIKWLKKHPQVFSGLSDYRI